MSKGLSFDPNKCRGCFSCVITCSTWNFGIGDLEISRIKVAPFPREAFFVPIACLQCETPYCSQVCPVKALVKNSDTGVVELQKEKCIGCKLCAMVCPFGNITFVNGYPSKCDLCGGDPSCVKACRWEALKFVEVVQIGDGRRTMVAQKVFESENQPLTLPVNRPPQPESSE